ncbi:MAG: ion transporter [Bacteroidetes bacterium]|nr:ion transporter [bacterium]NBP63576.1 ion transporter [Bacteroidota bacterium]
MFTDLLYKLRHNESNWFDTFILVIIIFSAILVGVETDKLMMITFHDPLHIANIVIHYIFVTEILIKIYAFRDDVKHYFFDGWNIFDIFIVLLGFLPLFITQDEATYEAVLAARTLRIFRSLKSLRVLRLIGRFKQLRTIVETLLHSIPTLWQVFMLMGILYYSYAVIGVFLFSENDPQHFGSLSQAVLTLFQVMTGDGWSELMKANMYNCIHPHPFLSPLYFCSFVLVGALIILNLFVGIIISEMDETRRRHLQEEMGEKMIQDTDDALLLRLQEYKQSFDKEMNTIIEELKRRKA